MTDPVHGGILRRGRQYEEDTPTTVFEVRTPLLAKAEDDKLAAALRELADGFVRSGEAFEGFRKRLDALSKGVEDPNG